MRERGGEGEVIIIKMQYVYVPIPQSDCNYYVLQIYIFKINFISMI